MSTQCSIPKIIWQTWKTKNVPDVWKSSPESWIKYHSDWQYFLMSDEDNRKFVETYFLGFYLLSIISLIIFNVPTLLDIVSYTSMVVYMLIWIWKQPVI